MTDHSACQPLLSVITVVRNGEREIEATLASICALHGDDVEVIVIDGASTDATLAKTRRFDSCIDTLLSEPDRGIYDAMNKGIRLARGRFVLHINVGDELLRVPRAELAAAADDVAALSFPTQVVGGPMFVPSTGWRLRIFNTLHHQGTCYRRTPALHYDATLRTFADFDLNQRTLHAGNVLCLPGAIALHRPDGISNDPRQSGELLAVIRRNQGLPWLIVAWLRFKIRGIQCRLKKFSLS